MKRYNEIPAADKNGLYWYFSEEHDNRTPNSVNAPEAVLVVTHDGERVPVQMIKRFGSGRQRFIKGYLLGPVEPPLLDISAQDVSKAPQLNGNSMTQAKNNDQAFKDAYDAGKASALAQLERGKPVLLVDEMDLSDLDFANARGWSSVFTSAENGRLLKAAVPNG